ncbi:dynamin family protein [Mesoflavibacter zeaxanthinifaciens]|uniref:dynamin family protein n=1 Tax=Mesoflavibacter zeaxanthinifaciens TaxID=393060 RepID=UPI003A8FA963
MNHLQDVNLLLENIDNLKLLRINTLNYLNNKKPTIFLCGKSTTGKTTFLNALLNMERDEMYTSTNISTKAEFRFEYGVEEVIEKPDGSLIRLPNNYSDRKSLFKSLNDDEESCCITLNREALKNRTIVDIPGVFDFSKNESFSNQMLDEADIVYFFTPCLVKIEPSEYKLLQSISESGIPIIVLFTMGDLTDIDEGITRKTIPELVHDRLDTCFRNLEITHYQIISSYDYYNNRDSHGIDALQQHILKTDYKYKKLAEGNRLKRTARHYINLIESEIDILNNKSDSFNQVIRRENELWQESELAQLNMDKESSIKKLNMEFSWLIKNCEEQILGNSYHKVYSKQQLTKLEQKKNFEVSWDRFWGNLENDFEFLQISKLKLPPIPDGLFEQIKVDIDKFKEFLGGNKEIESTNKKSSTSKSETNSKVETPEKKNGSKSETKVDEKTEDKTEDVKKVKQSDSAVKNRWKELSWTDFVALTIDFGVNLNNAKIIWKKWSYLNEIKSSINKVSNDTSKQIENEFDSRTNGLQMEMENRIKEGQSKDPTLELKSEYFNSLNQLKSI